MKIKVLNGNCLDVLSELPEQSVNTCITSPPYYGLRDYQTAEWKGGDENCEQIWNKRKNNDKLVRIAFFVFAVIFLGPLLLQGFNIM